jgi:hypothetical protein
MLDCTFPKEIYILMPWGEIILNISSFFLAAEHGYGIKGGRNFEAKVR